MVVFAQSVWLDRETGAKCYMLSARNLFIVWGDTPQYWTWIPLEDSRFSEGAQLMHVCWFEIRGKIHSKMLSQDTTYAAYMVFKTTYNFYGLDFPVQEASISAGATNSTRKVCLQGNDDDDGEGGVPENYRPMVPFPRLRLRRRNRRVVSHEENVALPQQRADGIWSSRSDDGGVAVSFLSWEHRWWSNAERQRQEVERLRLARSFDGDVKSCLAGKCYARQILQNLSVWMDERRAVALLGAVVASTDGRTGKDDANLSPEDGSAVR
uniref:Uncharacterized protein n=1 Tax=Aegilops tauschii TaxID=37682 RepID=M8B6B7_AEGTA